MKTNKKATCLKRVGAYILDAFIFSLIFGIFMMLIPESNNVINLNQQLSDLGEKFLNHDISISVYFNQYAGIVHSLDKELFLNNLFNMVLMIGYFTILPFYYNGQTFGKKILKIKVVKDNGELTMNDLLIRNMIINGILFSLIGFTIIFITKEVTYFTIISILGIIEILLVITSLFMVSYRHDKKAVHDILCKTSVIEEN